MANYKLYFADLHFHTNYSDNRDRATIEDMLFKGSKNSISIFGTADHNHNLDIKKWKAQVEETENLRSKYLNYLLMNNCEITFLLGHFVVINPPFITGTIEEGYEFLYTNSNIIKILAHPNPNTDEWHTRIIPHVSGIEVVNGSVFRKAISSGYKFETALDIPMLRSYSEYIAMGYPVAAIGNSDAHELAEMGSGMTGMYLLSNFKKEDVFAAIKNQKTFATTDPGIQLECAIDSSRQEFNWKISWKPKKSDSTGKYVIEVYNRSSRAAVTKNSGKIKVEKGGIYWAVIFSRENIAVSSPLNYKKTEPIDHNFGKTSFRKIGFNSVATRFKNTQKDIYWLKLHKDPSFNLSPIKKRGKAEIEIYSRTREPLITDALGNNVKYKISEPAEYRTIINKQCDNPCFDEFHIWLERNEIHEYNFLDINFKKEGNLFLFNALLIPAKMIFINNFGKKYIDILPDIKKLLSPKTNFKLNVKTLYKLLIQVDMDDYYFPLEIDKDKHKLHNYLLWISHEYRRQAWENIFQIFM